MSKAENKRVQALNSKAMLNDTKTAAKFEKLLSKAVEEGLKFAMEVFTSKEKIEVKQYTKEGEVKKSWIPLYTPDHKIRIFEKLADKIFADKKQTELITKSGDENPGTIAVAGFSFVPVKPDQKTE